MRPIPQSRHVLAAAILLSVAAGSTYFAWTDWRTSDEQVRALTVLQKGRQAGLYPHDYVFGGSGLWRFENPAFGAILTALARLGGDELTPFRILTAVMVVVFLGGMYALLYSQTRSWSVSVFVAILSMTVLHCLGGGVWGAGSLAATTPSGLVMAFTPLLALLYLNREGKTGLFLVFAWLGLLANLHVPSAGNMVILLLVIYLAQRRARPKAWLAAGLCGLTALAAAMPTMWYRWHLPKGLPLGDASQVSLVASQPASGPAALAAGATEDFSTAVSRAAKLAEWDGLYPRLLEGVWTWLLLIGVLLVVSAVILARGERFQTRHFSTWVWWILAALAVTFVFQGASQIWGLVKDAPATVGYARASALIFLPLYALLANALTTLFRILRGHRALARWGCALFMAAWMAPSDNFRAPRYALTDTLTMFVQKEERKPRYVQKHHERFQEWREMRSIANWARQATAADAIFVCESAELRFRSQRSVLAAREDMDCVYRFAPEGLATWVRALERQRKALDAGAPEALVTLASEPPPAPNPSEPSAWYVVLRPTDPASRELPNVPTQGWGRYYVVCKIR